MPDCPVCNITLGMWERGLICPVCYEIYSFDEAKDFNGFDLGEIVQAVDLYNTLLGSGMLGPGQNKIEFAEDALIISRLGDIY
jgi:hypothetical protein